MELAQQLVRAALDDTPFDLPDALKRLRELDEDVRLGPSTGSIVNAATARGIPYRRLTQGSMVQFGWGSKQRRIQAAETDLTSAISESIAQDKDLTRCCCWTRPACRCRWAARSPPPKQPGEAAQELGGPVVSSRATAARGRGVAVNIETRERVIQAFEVAGRNQLGSHRRALHPGHDFRLLVVGGNAGRGLAPRSAAGHRRRPPHHPPAGRAGQRRPRCAATATPPR